MDKRHYLIIGAGAIGNYVGGLLAANGYPVSVLARPETYARLTQQGLAVQQHGQLHQTPVQVFLNPSDALANPPAAIFLAVKSYHTASVIQNLQAYAASLPPLVCLQNGIGNEAALAAVFGADKIIAGTVTTAVSVTPQQVVVVEKPRGIGLANQHPLVPTLASDLTAAGITTRIYPNAAAMKWSKLLGNLVANASCAITGLTPAALLNQPALFKLEVAALREALAVMRAHNISAVNLPGGPMRALAFGVRRLPRGVYRPLFMQVFGTARGEKPPSFALDLMAGYAESEVGWLNGAVAEYGAKVNVATPVNARLTELLMAAHADLAAVQPYRQQPNLLAHELGIR